MSISYKAPLVKLLPLLLMSSALSPVGAQAGQYASDADAASAANGEILVTAQKSTERLKDVPLTISVVDPVRLITTNRTSFKDYLVQLPGVSLQQGGPGRSIISIRGVSSPNGNPLVGFAIDDVPFGASTFLGLGNDLRPDIDPTDIERVEVLQGPQGTLYGASSMGGLIKYVTAPPSLTETRGQIQADASSVAHGDIGYSVRGGFQTPLATGRAAIKASAFYRRDPGFIDDTVQGRKNVNNDETYGGRVALAAELTETLKLNASALYQRTESDGSSRVAVNFNLVPATGPYEHGALAGTDGYTTKVQFYNLSLEQEVGSLTLTALTGYTRTDFRGAQDFSTQFGGFIPFLYPGANVGLNFNERSRVRKFSQELRLASDNSGTITYLAGLFYTHEKTLLVQRLDPVALAAGAAAGLDPALIAPIPQTYDEYAAFANIGVKLTDSFDVQFGGRLSHNKQKFSETDTGIIGSGVEVSGRSKGSPFTFSISPRLHLNEDSMLYGRVSTGYRVGGPNASPPPGVPTQFGADKTTNYEIGLKSDLLDKMATLNLAVYQIIWRNIQISVSDPATGFAYYTNGPRAKVKGAQADLSIRPVTGLSLGAAFAYTDSVLARDTDPTASVFGVKGDRLPYVAKWSGTLSADYKWDMGEQKPFLGASLSYTGNRDTGFTAAGAIPRLRLPSFTTVDLYGGVDFSGFTISAFVKNITDKRGYIGADALTPGTLYNAALITPRTIGVSASAKF